MRNMKLLHKLHDRIKFRDAVRQASQWIRRQRTTGSRLDHLARTDGCGSQAETAMVAVPKVADRETRDPTGAALRATRLAHEAGVRWIGQLLTDLESQRRWAVAVTSATVLSLTFPATLFGQHARFESLGVGAAYTFGGLLLSLFLLGRCVLKISAPLRGEFVQNPKRIIAEYVECPQPAQSEQEVYRGLAWDLGNRAERIEEQLRRRRSYLGLLIVSSGAVILSTTLVLLDAYRPPLST